MTVCSLLNDKNTSIIVKRYLSKAVKN